MNRNSSPKQIKARAPTLTAPRLVKTSQSRFSFSLGSGLCSQSSFSTSSGNSSRPVPGKMLYFSETVWVLRSSSLPAREGALESSNGEANGPYLESRLPMDSELQLVRREETTEGESSRKPRVRVRVGGSRCSAESATAALR